MRILVFKKKFAAGIVIVAQCFVAAAFAEEKAPCSNKEQSDNPPSNTIDNIAINIAPVFDENNPDENNWIFRGVNYLHINTHPNVIKNDLLFKEGDVLDEKVLAESERKLRTRPYLNNATITQQTSCVDDNSTANNVNINVREVWTLLPELTFSHAGGKSSSGVGLHDSNFLGLGKTVNISHTVTPDRSGNLFEYHDPNTGIADSIFAIDYADNSDGIVKSTELIKPFAALSTEWSAGFSYEDYSEEGTLYNAGKEADRFAHSNTNHSVFYGFKLNTGSNESVHRILVGYNTWRDNFASVTTDSVASVFVPGDRQYNYPWIEYQHVYDGYIQAYNIQQINRVEDINLGAQVRLRLGYTSSKYTGYDKDYYIESEYSQAFLLSKTQMVLANVTATGLYGGSELFGKSEFYNSVAKAIASYHWQDFNHGQFFLSMTSARGFHQFGDLPLELGGDTGLRGYPARYQAGDHLRLITVEQRFFGEREWLSLFHMGAAIFFDEGRAWGEAAIPQTQVGRLRDVGIGLRISGTRTGNRQEGSHNIVHFDIAYPLDAEDDKDISKIQWLVRVKQSF